MAKSGPRKVNKISDEFKATAVRLTQLEGVQVQEVAEALDIHPFMLSRWRKQVREGVIVADKTQLDIDTAAELKELRKIKQQYAILQMEHELLKKTIQYASDRDRKSSPSSTASENDSPSR